MNDTTLILLAVVVVLALQSRQAAAAPAQAYTPPPQREPSTLEQITELLNAGADAWTAYNASQPPATADEYTHTTPEGEFVGPIRE